MSDLYHFQAIFRREETRAFRVIAENEEQARHIALQNMQRLHRMNPKEWDLKRIEKWGRIDR